MNSISKTVILEYLNSREEFPIDFDDAWKWIGYSTKQKGLQTLKSNFEEGIDFLTKGLKSSQGGRRSEHIVLTIDCCKSLAMMAGTPKGREVRKYFLECERRLKELVAQAQPRQHQQLWWDRLALFQTHSKIPDGYWCVYMELHLLLVQELEVKGFVFPEGACPDISVGRCWCDYLHRQENIEPNEFPDYDHHYPDQRGKQSARIYPDSLLPLFRRWLRATYVPGQFPAYVRQLCTPEECNLVAAAIGYEVKPIRQRLSAE